MTGLYGELPPQLFKNYAHPKPHKEVMKEVTNMEVRTSQFHDFVHTENLISPIGTSEHHLKLNKI